MTASYLTGTPPAGALPTDVSPPERAEHSPVVRLSVNLSTSVADALKSTAADQGVSVTEGTRRAVALWKLVSDERAKGNRLMIVEGHGGRAQYREIVLL